MRRAVAHENGEGVGEQEQNGKGTRVWSLWRAT